MRTTHGRIAAAALLALLAAASLSACGKRGVLDTPPPLFGDRARARYEAQQQQRSQDAADSRARTGNSTAAADQDDAPLTTRDIRSPEEQLTPASRAPINGAPDLRGPPVNPTPPY